MNTFLMATSSSVTIANSSLLGQIPEFLAWLVGIVLATFMVRQGGGKAEKLLLVGCSLMFVASLVSPLLGELVQWLRSEEGMSNIATAQTMGLVYLPLAVLDIAALVCLIWAFWLKFWVKRRETA